MAESFRGSPFWGYFTGETKVWDRPRFPLRANCDVLREPFGWLMDSSPLGRCTSEMAVNEGPKILGDVVFVGWLHGCMGAWMVSWLWVKIMFPKYGTLVNGKKD